MRYNIFIIKKGIQMKKLPNYGMLYLRFLKTTFDLRLVLFFPLIQFVILMVFGSPSKNTDYFSVANHLMMFLKSIGDFYMLIGIPYNIAVISAYVSYVVFTYLIFMGFLFIILELRYLRWRLKGYSTQEIDEILEKRRAEKNIKNKDDY
jgi:hypothetical protein